MMTYQDVVNYLDDHDDESNKMGEVLEFVKYQQKVNKEQGEDLDRLTEVVQSLRDKIEDFFV